MIIPEKSFLTIHITDIYVKILAVIALSIVYLARELGHKESDSFIRRYPELVAAGFGLFHGLGFAGALKEVGLPHDALSKELDHE